MPLSLPLGTNRVRDSQKSTAVGVERPWNILQPDNRRWSNWKHLNVGMCTQGFCSLLQSVVSFPIFFTCCLISLSKALLGGIWVFTHVYTATQKKQGCSSVEGPVSSLGFLKHSTKMTFQLLPNSVFSAFPYRNLLSH